MHPYALALVSPQATALNPAGAVIAFAGANVPSGYLVCDGSAVSRTTYANLFAAIGTAWGTGDGSTTFNLPDMRVVFLRGVNGTRSDAFADPDDNATLRTSIFPGGNTGNAVGSYQADQFKAHQHDNGAVTCGNFYYPTAYNIYGTATAAYVPSPAVVWGNETEYTGNTGPQGGSETRPKNVYVNYIIKY